PSPPFPFRLFSIGEEPLGIRDTPYHKHFFISKILNALDEDEVKVLSDSPFEKLVKFAKKSSFSGWFGRFLISRQLKVVKKDEDWFLFSGKTVRFSHRCRCWWQWMWCACCCHCVSCWWRSCRCCSCYGREEI
ncbi:unnamed protein product, partial [Brassica oleracea]